MRSRAVEDSLKSPASMSLIEISGERLGENAAVSKTVVHRKVHRGFESPPLRFRKPRTSVETRSVRPGFHVFRASSRAIRGQTQQQQTSAANGLRRTRTHVAPCPDPPSINVMGAPFGSSQARLLGVFCSGAYRFLGLFLAKWIRGCNTIASPISSRFSFRRHRKSAHFRDATGIG